MNARIQELEQALTALQGTERVDGLNKLSQEYVYLDAHKVIAIAQEAESLAHQLGYTQGLATAWLNQGFGALRLGDFAQCLMFANRAQALFEQLQHPQGLLAVLNAVGIVHINRGEWLEALRAFLQVLQIAQNLGEQGTQANAHNNLAAVHQELGSLDEALDNYLKALAFYEKLGALKGQATCLNNIGIIYREEGLYSEALEYYQRSQHIKQQISDRAGYAYTLGNMGLVYLDLENVPLALACFAEQLETLQTLGDQRGICHAHNHLGRCFTLQGQLSQAEEHLRMGLQSAHQLGLRKEQQDALVYLSELRLAQGQDSEALEHLEQSLQLLGEEARLSRMQVHKARYQTFKSLGRYPQALHEHELYHQLTRELFNQASDKRLQALRVGLEVEAAHKEKEVYRQKNRELEALTQSLHQLNQEKSLLVEALERQTRTDALTQIANRRHFEEALHIEALRVKRFGEVFSLLVLDIDNFKGINDRFSHLLGDRVLQTVAQLLQSGVREVDTVARWGGEEFVVLLAQTTLSEALQVAERLRLAVQQHPWPNLAPGLLVTLSIGVCDSQTTQNTTSVLKDADEQLYLAKRLGKNQVQPALL